MRKPRTNCNDDARIYLRALLELHFRAQGIEHITLCIPPNP
ncbi:MAG TPA: hypothetical protein VFB23_01185 [Candidatus Acidoferrales bacterium]|nr:hypothetical protein [Candidatus Acidoferrales bacterium]